MTLKPTVNMQHKHCSIKVTLSWSLSQDSKEILAKKKSIISKERK